MNANQTELDLDQPKSRDAPEPIKILLVDDQRDSLLALEALLRRSDVAIFTAQSGADALGLLLLHEFALAFIDVQMPIMDGIELAELMRGTRKTKDVQIIFVTASSNDSIFSYKSYQSGAVDFLPKPLNAHAVKSKANIFIEIFRQKKELQSVESKFRGLLETAPDAMVIVNEGGKIEMVNKQTETIFGYDRIELIGQPLEMLMPERFNQAHVRLRREYAAHPSVRPMGRALNLFGRRKDGAEFSIDISLSSFKSESGALVSAAIRDITVRHASQ